MSNQIDFSKKQSFNGEKSVKESYGSKNYMEDIVNDVIKTKKVLKI